MAVDFGSHAWGVRLLKLERRIGGALSELGFASKRRLGSGE
jgi:hypothetical protein